MKTLTEFPSLNLKNAAKLKHDLSAAGKTIEELPAALGESLKLEGNRLTFLMTSLEMVEKKFENLKRIVVFALNENEKAPPQAIQKGEHYYLVEYYPLMNQNAAPDPSDRNDRGRGGKRGGKPGGKEGDNKRGRDRPQGSRPAFAGPSTNPTGQIIINTPKVGEHPSTARPARPPRPPRAPRPPAVAKGPDGRPIPTPGVPPKLIAPKGKIIPRAEATEATPSIEVEAAHPPQDTNSAPVSEQVEEKKAE